MERHKKPRSMASYANQRRRGWERGASKIALAPAPLAPTYMTHTRQTTALEIRVEPLIERWYAIPAFRGRTIRRLRSSYPWVPWVPWMVKAGQGHLHGQWYRLYLDHSNYGFCTIELICHLGPQRFKRLGAQWVISVVTDTLLPPMDCDAACALPDQHPWPRNDDDDEYHDPSGRDFVASGALRAACVGHV